MFGMDGFGVPVGFALTVLSTLLCVGYGLRNWNKGALGEEEACRKQSWEAEEKRIEENL